MLSAGTRLGPYEIAAPIGAGGMGEVYRALDTRLGREVAVKILPAEFAQDAKLKIRFEREARAISNLSHPNVCTLYDVGENFIVMELLSGESLAQRLLHDRLPMRKAIDIAAAIADGLASAHARGIIHRDLKPANIFLTTDGQVKILDFGLAKQAQRGDVVESHADTQTSPHGAIVGTLGYMSPEQVSGRQIDTRSDIFSLGCVLYEMISGERAFVRASTA